MSKRADRPDRPSTDGAPCCTDSTVRRRARRHMRMLLTAGAAAAALASCESSIESRGGTGSSGSGGSISSSSGQGGEGGEIVCDALPPPLVCTGDPSTDDFRDWISWWARWQDVGGNWMIGVELRIDLWGDPGKLIFIADPHVSGGSANSILRDEQSLKFVVEPGGGGGGGAGGSGGAGTGGAGGAGGIGDIGLIVELNCNEIAEQLALRLDTSGTPQDGANVPMASME